MGLGFSGGIFLLELQRDMVWPVNSGMDEWDSFDPVLLAISGKQYSGDSEI